MTSWLGSWFTPPASKKAEAPVDALESMDKLEDSLRALEIRKASHVSKIKPQQDALSKQAATANAAGNRTLAMQLLKKRAALEQPLKALDGQIANLQHTISMMESTATTAQTADALKTGTASMKTMIQAIDVDQVEDLHDDLSEVAVQAHDINNALARPIFTDYALDDEDAPLDEAVAAQMAEWDAARHEEMIKQMPAPPVAVADPGRGNSGGGTPAAVLAPVKEKL